MKGKQIKLKVLGAMLLIEPDKEQENTTKSGIILTEDSLAHRYKYGTVKKLGTGVVLPTGIRTEFNVKVGDRVLYKDFAGIPIEIDGIEYLEMVESDLLGVIEN